MFGKPERMHVGPLLFCFVMDADDFRSKDVEEFRRNSFFVTSASGFTTDKPPADTEGKRRKALELHANATAAVLDLEERLNIAVRWEPGSFEWQDAAKLVANRRFQRALDHLEGLVISRMFELTRMNMARTGAFLYLICRSLPLQYEQAIIFVST